MPPRGRGKAAVRGQPAGRARLVVPVAGSSDISSPSPAPTDSLSQLSTEPDPTTLPTILFDPKSFDQPPDPQDRRPLTRGERLQVLANETLNKPVTLKFSDKIRYKVQHSVLIGISAIWQRELEHAYQENPLIVLEAPSDDVARRFGHWLFYRDLMTDQYKYRKVWEASQDAIDNRHGLVPLYNFAVEQGIPQLQNQIVQAFHDAITHWIDLKPGESTCPIAAKTIKLIYESCGGNTALVRLITDIICESMGRGLSGVLDAEVSRFLKADEHEGGAKLRIKSRMDAINNTQKYALQTVVVGWEIEYRVEGDLASPAMVEADDAPGRNAPPRKHGSKLYSGDPSMVRVKFGPEGVEYFVQAGLLMGVSPMWRRRLEHERTDGIPLFPLPNMQPETVEYFMYWLFFRDLNLQLLHEDWPSKLIGLYIFGARFGIAVLQNAVLNKFRQMFMHQVDDTSEDKRPPIPIEMVGSLLKSFDLIGTNLHILFGHILCEGVLKAGHKWYTASMAQQIDNAVWVRKYYQDLITEKEDKEEDSEKVKIQTAAIEREVAYLRSFTVQVASVRITPGG